MSNICIFINTLLDGGAEKQAVLLAKILSNKYKVILVVYYGNKISNKFKSFITQNKIQVIYLKGNIFFKVIRFMRIMKENKTEIIFTYLLTANLVGGILGKITGVKYVYSGIRNSILPRRKFLVQKFIHTFISSQTIFNNYRGMDNLVSLGFKRDKSLVIHNSFEVNERHITRESKEIVTILSVGRFVPQKDWLSAIKSILLLRKKNKNFRYVIIGYGVLENEIREFVNFNNAMNYIQIFINPNDIDKYYLEADIYFQTSLFEGLSNTVMEAMSFSLPLVVTDVGDNQFLAKSDVNGFLCRINNVEEYTTALNFLVNNYNQRILMGEASLKILKEDFSVEQFITKYMELIKKC